MIPIMYSTHLLYKAVIIQAQDTVEHLCQTIKKESGFIIMKKTKKLVQITVKTRTQKDTVLIVMM